MAVLGLRFCARASSSCGKRGPLFITVRGPLTIVASLVEHRLQTRRLSSCVSRAQLLRGMWDLPRPGLEPMSPALAGRLSTTAPPGKPCRFLLVINFIHISVYMSIPIAQFSTPPSPPHRGFLPWCPYVCSLQLCHNFCPANWFICTIFLGSTYMC